MYCYYIQVYSGKYGWYWYEHETVRVYVYINIYIYIYLFIPYASEHVWTHETCMYACMNAWLHVCMYACMYVYANLNEYVYVCIHVSMHVCLYVCVHPSSTCTGHGWLHMFIQKYAGGPRTFWKAWANKDPSSLSCKRTCQWCTWAQWSQLVVTNSYDTMHIDFLIFTFAESDSHHASTALVVTRETSTWSSSLRGNAEPAPLLKTSPVC